MQKVGISQMDIHIEIGFAKQNTCNRLATWGMDVNQQSTTNQGAGKCSPLIFFLFLSASIWSKLLQQIVISRGCLECNEEINGLRDGAKAEVVELKC